MNGICGWLAKVVVTCPVEGLVVTLPTSFWSMPWAGAVASTYRSATSDPPGVGGVQGVRLELPSQPRYTVPASGFGSSGVSI